MKRLSIETSNNQYLVLKDTPERDILIQFVDWDGTPLSPERRFNAYQLINYVKAVKGMD